MSDVVIGVDVGTGSARAGVFDLAGAMLAEASTPIRMWRPRANFVQQSSTDIWEAVCQSVRNAVSKSGANDRVRGIGFDATCSLVLRDAQGGPVSVDPDGAPKQDDIVQDVIVWMDHRAIAQADRINAGSHDVLRFVGGRISPEMETPKLLWLHENLPAATKRAAHFFDLPDFLTWQATGSLARSLCSTVCKWTYLGHEARWDEGFFRAIGLGALADEGFARIGRDIRPMGSAIAPGLSAEAASALNLPPGTPVATSAIDAHAGGLGVIGAQIAGGPPALRQRVALIGGTSSCLMAVNPEPLFVPGVWGPYFSAMVPGMWLNEGGQSASGNLIDHILQTHAAYPALLEAARNSNKTVYHLLAERLARLSAGMEFPAALTAGLHVLPDFNGNRSPRADATLRGMIVGLPLSATEDDLAVLYLATIQGIAYGVRHIIETLNASGYAIDTIMACGGGTKNPIFLREHADATGCRLVLPRESEAVLLGAAMLGAVAGAAYADLPAAMAGMSHAGMVLSPTAGAVRDYHDTKFKIFHRLHDDQCAYRDIMARRST
jgi:FGGY-family pentulose kinase